MITFSQLQELTKQQSILEEERKARMAVVSIKKRILEQLSEKANQREENFGNVSVGDLVEANGQQFEVIKVESSYVTVITEQGNMLKKWLHECLKVGVSKNQPLTIAEGQINFKGYQSKHLDQNLVEHIRRNNSKMNPFILLSFLQSYDQMCEETDIKKLKRLAEQTFKYTVKLAVPYGEKLNSIDDSLILEAAQGNISYSAPNQHKVKVLLETLGVETNNNKYDNEIVNNLLHMIRN